MGEFQTVSDSRNDRLILQIRQLCQSLGISQRDLAASLQLKPSQMNLYMQGKVEMKADRLLQVLSILGLDIEALLNQRLTALAQSETPVMREQTVLAKIGRLDEYKRESLLKIISILGSK